MKNKKFCGLYLHIPFCVKKCAYCDFLSFGYNTFGGEAKAKERMIEYTDLLIKEIELIGDSNRQINSIFIGGGTPSLLPESMISRIMNSVFANFNVDSNAEISMEANPGTIFSDKLTEYRNAGINRISLGVQSLDDDVLRSAGRIHTAKDASAAFKMLRDAGFTNIGIDMMAGLPKQDKHSLLESLKTVCDLEPEHISFYPLILEENTVLEASCRAGLTVLPGEDDCLEMEHAGIDYIESMGYSRYEISNFAKKGCECKHNLNYWRYGEYLAAGLGASSAVFEGDVLNRYRNLADWDAYKSAIIAGEKPAVLQECARKNEQCFEMIMLGLRKTDGISLDDFSNRFKISITDAFEDAIRKNTELDYLKLTNERLFLTSRGLEMQNTVLLDFMN